MATSTVVTDVGEVCGASSPVPGVGSRSISADARANAVARELALREDLQLAADSVVPTLVCGERAGDIERFALRIHQRSTRCGGPFEIIDAALRELQAALFDSIRDLLAGRPDTAGWIDKARAGTLFIPHVEEMSPALQTALLHVLEMPNMRTPAGVRLIVGTTGLDEQVVTGTFCEDLFYRLNMITIRVPPTTAS